MKSETVTRLSVCKFKDSRQAFAALLKWPARLESFIFEVREVDGPKTTYYLNSIDDDWSPSLSQLIPYVSCQRSTLRTLVLTGHEKYPLGARTSEIDLNLGTFTSLEKLTLSAWATGHQPATARALLTVAPCLRDFVWVFDGRCLFTDFVEAEELFLRELVKDATHGLSTLEKVHVSFNPVLEIHHDEARLRDVVYSWDRMDNIISDIAVSGRIRLTYDSPRITREDFVAVQYYELDMGLI
ncbi:hypothetical protein QBC34DRAFT_28201 [Podospora aff. communis PSN243]|uniref:Uncharacterized protein n=1 Tax=Podospora aff. communis PSN243 TaxID=3040156 RepID=A0AAV9GZP0_9PEZI|nr:hypothetical protein QBC34DRAFT_28201 [Podospora aff. communis PSN243]